MRYEIARSVIKGNGLLTVFIHGVQNKDKATSTKGADPLAQMGLYRTDRGIYLAEWKDGKWVAYADYTLAIPEGDLWFTAPKTNSVVQLSNHCLSYDFIGQMAGKILADGLKLLREWLADERELKHEITLPAYPAGCGPWA